MTTEEQQLVERLTTNRGELHGTWLETMSKAADVITRLVEERDEARRIIAACASALPNGAFIDAERASLKFMAHLPGEISAVCQGLSRASEAKVAELTEALKQHEQLLAINAVRAVAVEHAPLWLEAADAAAERMRAK